MILLLVSAILVCLVGGGSGAAARSGYKNDPYYGYGGDGSQRVGGNTFNDMFPAILDAPTKFKLFLMCRSECSAKCDRLVYLFAPKKSFCHQCIQECLQVVREQAKAVGVSLSDSPVCRKVVNEGGGKRWRKGSSGKKWGMAADQPANAGGRRRGGRRGRGRGRGRKGRGRRRRMKTDKASDGRPAAGVGLFKNCILQ